jgi:hypothetical protein
MDTWLSGDGSLLGSQVPLEYAAHITAQYSGLRVTLSRSRPSQDRRHKIKEAKTMQRHSRRLGGIETPLDSALSPQMGSC